MYSRTASESKLWLETTFTVHFVFFVAVWSGKADCSARIHHEFYPFSPVFLVGQFSAEYQRTCYHRVLFYPVPVRVSGVVTELYPIKNYFLDFVNQSNLSRKSAAKKSALLIFYRLVFYSSIACFFRSHHSLKVQYLLKIFQRRGVGKLRQKRVQWTRQERKETLPCMHPSRIQAALWDRTVSILR